VASEDFDRGISWHVTAVLALLSFVWATIVYAGWLVAGPLIVSDAAFHADSIAFFDGLFGALTNLPKLQFAAAVDSFASIHWLTPTTWMYVLALAPTHAVMFAYIAVFALSIAEPVDGGATPDGE